MSIIPYLSRQERPPSINSLADKSMEHKTRSLVILTVESFANKMIVSF